MGADMEASGEKGMQCASNYEDRMFLVDDDAEVNIDDDVKQKQVEAFNGGRCGGDGGSNKDERDDATESISSFGDTASEADNGTLFSENEVESRDCGGNAPTSVFHGCKRAIPIRRKRLTDHWRRFIRPLMWRCKWLEIQIREFQSQAQKYDRELAEHEQRKRFDYGTFMVEGFHARSLPFSCCMQRKKAMKRKKRKRSEQASDVASYTLKHNLFSYYENKKSVTCGASLDDDSNYLVEIINGSDDIGLLEGLVTESTNTIHEDIFRKIEMLQFQVHKLKARIERVVNENPGKFASVNRLSLASPSTDQNPPLLPENGMKMPFTSPYALSHHMSEGNMGRLMPESAVSSHGEVTPLNDMVESKGQSQVGVSFDNAEEGITTDKHVIKEDMESPKSLGGQPIEKPVVATEKQMVQASEPNLSAEMIVARVRYGGKSLPKSRSIITYNKRKRGRRISGAVGWNRR